MENLGIDIKLIFSQILNFAVFFFIFFRFIAKPFSDYLARQKEMEKEREELAANTKKQQDELAAEQEKIKETMKKELAAALAKAKEEGKIARDEAVEKAKKEAEDIVKKAHEQIEADRAEMMKELKDKSTELSLLLLNKGLNEYLDDNAKKQVTRYIIEKFSKENLTA